MAVVVDSNVLLILLGDEQRSPRAQQQVSQWLAVGESLHAPALARYEIANGLTRLIVSGDFAQDDVPTAWQHLQQLPITYHPLDVDGPQVIDIALRLGRQNAYDAAYLVLAQQLGAELWTFDGPLSRNASGLGFPVRLIS